MALSSPGGAAPRASSAGQLPGLRAPDAGHGGSRAVARPALCFDKDMVDPVEEARVVSAAREIDAPAERIFELIADPAQQPRWDGNENLQDAPIGQRVQAVGDVFSMRLSTGGIRQNHVVDFVEGRRIAWRPAEVDKAPPGHLWVWELDPLGPSRTRVTHTYDWTQLADEHRMTRARATTPDRLRASLDRLAALAEEAEQ